MYSANKTSGQWRAHGRYIARDGAGAPVFSNLNETADAAKALETWQTEGDPRLWKLIVSPEFGGRVDLERLTRDLMRRMEKDLGTRLEWVGVTHFNTEHPHVHVALRGIRENRSALDLDRNYVRSGIRSIAEDLCTRQIGHRTELDALSAERREIQERRFTSLDRRINRFCMAETADSRVDGTHFVVHRTSRLPQRERERNVDARLVVLQQMGLAERSAPQEWLLRRDFETVLKAMQRATDRQKMLATHSALLSDERLPFEVLDLPRLKSVEGRVLAHGEDEAGPTAGRHYLLLEGTDAKVHLIYYTPELEQARGEGKLRANSFARLRKRFEHGRPALEVTDFGNAEKLLQRMSFLISQRAPSILNNDHKPEPVVGGWLGRYHNAIAAAFSGRKQLVDRGAGRLE